jgi:sigma-B regulation protein RsbU (phosphoserine phosphatase)
MEAPGVDGLAIAAAFRPAGDGREAGGDFYDVFPVDDHEWLVVVGDVSGKGVAAAAVTEFVRQSVRDLAPRFRDPAALLAALNRAVLDHDTDRFCTVVVVRLADEGGHWSLTGSVGGHPLPVLRRPDGSVAEVGAHGSLVGVIAAPTFTTFEHPLGDDLLLIYTDGVTEARHDGELFGLEGLLPLVAGCDHEPAALTATVLGAVLDFQDGDPRDDIAVLALARDGERRAPG